LAQYFKLSLEAIFEGGQAMPVEIIDAAGKLLQIKIRGMLKKADYDRIIQIAKAAIAREGKVRALAILDGFEGWERHEDWGDVSFMMDQGQQIEKMAIVGDEKWRDDALAFTAKGFRPTAIEFFPALRMNEARIWLNAR
jgi:stage II sporulation SpoAA-like protein